MLGSGNESSCSADRGQLYLLHHLPVIEPEARLAIHARHLARIGGVLVGRGAPKHEGDGVGHRAVPWVHLPVDGVAAGGLGDGTMAVGEDGQADEGEGKPPHFLPWRLQ